MASLRADLTLLLALAGPVGAAGESAASGYLAADACASCHRAIYDAYKRTGMGRSFRPVEAGSFRNGSFYHEASDQHFLMSERDGRLVQRRWQTDAAGRQINTVEMEADFVLGSGEHARTFLHRTAAGELLELPVGWYRKNGGTWAMNPGYDQPDHMDFRRKLDRECFFCHNAYPFGAEGAGPAFTIQGAMPEGIDCQRCHGPVRSHVQLAVAGKGVGEVRAAVVNPARLGPERQNEVCFQCHLESTSRRLPYAMRRFDRGFFSYRPGEPLANYILHFDQAPGAGHDGPFEINHAAFRLMQSACYRKSAGALTCTSCHDPHGQLRAEEAAQQYRRACMSCHASAHFTAAGSASCVECHMAKRRTADVVHAVMTDHEIRRGPATRDLSPPLRETHEGAYRGPVALLYPRDLPEGPDADLYLAVAQVAEDANIEAGIPLLRNAIAKWRPAEAGFYRTLAAAYRKTGDFLSSLSSYEEALRRSADDVALRADYAQALFEARRAADAIRMLESGKLADASVLNVLGTAYLAVGRTGESAAVLRRAVRLHPDLPETHVNLANALARAGDRAGAVEELNAAIRLRPGSATAHSNLATILSERGDFEEGRDHFERAIRCDPESPIARYNYGRALAGRKLYRDAEGHLCAALRLDPRLAEAAVALGLVFIRTGRVDAAIDSYRRAIAVNPDLAGARYNLALGLMARGEKIEAAEQFEMVIRAQPQDYESRLRLGRILMERGEYRTAATHLEAAAASPEAVIRTAAQAALREARKAAAR